MHNLRPNAAAHEAHITQGARAFASGLGICDNPLQGDAATAWEVGWLNEMRNWVGLIASVGNKAGELIQERKDVLFPPEEEPA